MAKPKNDKDTEAKGFEIEQVANDPAVVAEEAVMDTPEAPKGISLYIDPSGKETTAIMFALNNEAVSLKTIEDKIAEYDKLTINGFLDKKGYEAVKKAKSEFLKTRTTLEKSDNENVIKPIEAWIKNRKTTRETLSEKLKAGQQKMQDKLDAIDKEFEEHQRKIEEAQQQRVQGRVNALAALGAVYSDEGGIYTFPHDSGLLINSLQVKQWEDAEWTEFIMDAQSSYDIEQNRLTVLKEEQEAQDLKNKQLLEGLETKTTALQEKQIKLRTKELLMNGANSIEGGFILNGNEISEDVLKVMEDEDWDNLISMMTEPAVDEPEAETATEPAVDEPEAETAPEPTTIIAGPPVAEANRPSGSIPFGGYAPSPGFAVEEDIPVVAEQTIVDGLPESKFYEAEVEDFGDKVTTFEEFKDWAYESILEAVREETPHGERGVDSRVMPFRFEGKDYEVNLAQIDWNRHDKQYYFIDMYGEPKLEVTQVNLRPGKRPTAKVDFNHQFTREQPHLDHQFKKVTLRVFPAEFEMQANEGVAAADIIDAGIFAGTELKYLQIKRPQ